ncbi:Myh9 protein [Spinellus fusiger]|nr:Myh9 protein [Spinellus fusiger]
MNPPKFDKVEDMADLTYLNEPSVIYNLSMRYKSHFIYWQTYSGLFLVAINPYKDLPIYSDEYLQSYKGRRRGELAPHIYAVADQAYHDMVRNNENQSILITGESGAGKTENTKRVIQYLTSVASERGHPDLGQRTTDKLGMQILQANPILEAFGNAQTIRNNNSSRFGKFIRIEFNQRAHICGANIEWYLLERSRIHQQSLKERGYHVFYQLLSSDKETKEKLLLGSSQPEDYGFIKRSNTTIQGVDDAEEYRHLLDAMDIMGLSEKERFGLFRIVAAVLHLGNIVVTKDYRGDRADINDFTVVEKVCHLLGIPAQDFKNSLLSPRIKAGRDWVNQSKSPAQVITSLDVLAKTLYERSFAALVERINKAIDTQKSVDRMGFIGVLDIAGFEIFEVNSFEQLCINYTNEKLQQFFNHNMFELEQEEYEKEKIEWSYIDFGLDLQPTIDLIEKTNPVGIISCLEEECVAPRGTDNRFLEKLNTIWDRGDPEQKYKSTRFKDGFIIKHYAGDVEYVTNGWIDKNKDPLNEDTTRLLARSNFHYVASLFEDYLDTDSEVTRDSIRVRSELTLMKLRKGGGSFRTVGQRHKQQLLSLMNTLYTTHPHFVRCIVPNHGKKAGEIDTKLVLDQLRCNGVLEGIRICRTGYPNRLSFADFRKRYEILCPNRLKPNSFIDGQSASQALLDAMKLEHEKYRIGVTKVFFKATVLAELEERRDKTLSEYVAGFQAICRRYMARQKMQRCVRQTEAIRVMQRNARIYVTLREWPWWKIYAKLKPLNVAYRVDTQIKEKDQKIATLTSQIKDYQIHAAQLADDNETLLSQQTDYKTLLMNAQTMVHELEEGKQDLLDKLTLAEEHGEEVEHLLQDTREQLETSDQKAQTQATLIARLHQDILECSQDNERLADQCNAYHETHQTMVVQLASVTKRNEEADKEKESLQASLMALKKKEEEWKLQQQKDIQARTHLESDYKASLFLSPMILTAWV